MKMISTTVAAVLLVVGVAHGCPTEAVEKLQCTGTECQRCSVKCVGECEVRCVGDQKPCEGLAVDGQGASGVRVECDGGYACAGLRVTQPRVGETEVVCRKTGSCESLSVLPAEGPLPRFLHRPVNVQCEGEGSCVAGRVVCSAFEDCTVGCSGERSCYFARFERLQGSDFDVTCGGLRSCERARFVSPKPLQVFQTKTCLKCSGERSCENFEVDCEKSDCNVACTGLTSCERANVTKCGFPDQDSSSCNVQCRNVNACQFLETDCDDRSSCVRDCLAGPCDPFQCSA